MRRLVVLTVSCGLMLAGGGIASWTLSANGTAMASVRKLISGSTLKPGSVSEKALSKGVKAKLNAYDVPADPYGAVAGKDGLMGPTGAPGLPGADGAASTAVGAVGPAGPAGPAGASGPAGPQGAAGGCPDCVLPTLSNTTPNNPCTAVPGVRITSGSQEAIVCWGAPGPASTVPGPTGPAGPAGTGDKGDTGSQGPKGEPGSDGQDGSPGRDGTGCDGQPVTSPPQTCPGSPAGGTVTRVQQTATLSSGSVTASCGGGISLGGGFSGATNGTLIKESRPIDGGYRVTLDASSAQEIVVYATCLG